MGLINYYKKKSLSENRKKKLSDNQIEDILNLRGVIKQREIADKFNISQSHVNNIFHNRHNRKNNDW